MHGECSCHHFFGMSDRHSNQGHATEIPELLLNIGDFLGRDSLVSSVRVCKLWCRVLEPLLYKTIDRRPLPPVEVLQRHLRDIHTLILQKGDSDEKDERLHQLYLCRNLRTLDVRLPDWHFKDNFPELDLIKANRQLLSLKIRDDKSLLFRSWWDRMLSDSSSVLQELCLTNVHLGVDANAHLLRIAQSLLELNLINCRITPLDVQVTPQFTNMKVFVIADVFHSPLQELEWISHCPRIKTLLWKSCWWEGPRCFFQEIRSLRWPHLTHLDLSNWTQGSRKVRDIEIAALLDACDNLRSVSVSGSAFWYRSLKSLERHLPTLDELDISDCLQVEGWMCHWILTQSPKLRSFYCEYIEAHELVMDCPNAKAIIYDRVLQEVATNWSWIKEEERETLAGPEFQESRDELRSIIVEFEAIRIDIYAQRWACLDLEDFLCCIVHSPEIRQDWDTQILKRLSSLKKLKYLDLSVKDTTAQRLSRDLSIWHGLCLDLKSGLAQLETLRKLEVVLFTGTRQNLGEEDCRWMLDHWPALKQVSSDLHPDNETMIHARN